MLDFLREKELNVGSKWSIREAKTYFSKLINEVEKEGKIQIIEKRGKPVSIILPLNVINDRILKDILFEFYIERELEKRIKNLKKEEENAISLSEFKKKKGI
ncbi:type II toxin-antitoxin system Phd/YefM family antitoxin [bacterium]|nr:type II toxin-antitoxin system Phd/YefM family antitoxin [bacterium]